MTLAEFLKQYAEQVFDTEQLARAASKVTDDESLAQLGRQYIAALREFEDALDAIGFERG